MDFFHLNDVLNLFEENLYRLSEFYFLTGNYLIHLKLAI